VSAADAVPASALLYNLAASCGDSRRLLSINLRILDASTSIGRLRCRAMIKIKAHPLKTVHGPSILSPSLSNTRSFVNSFDASKRATLRLARSSCERASKSADAQPSVPSFTLPS